jgi:protein-tyrosine phosphatase
MAPLRLLFVCSGNICRSPLAEAVFRHLAEERGLGSRFELDSAGMHGYHEGERADPRARRVGRRHGVEVTSIAREIEDSDLDRFDLVVAMDRGHLRQLTAMAGPARRGKLVLMRDFEGGSTGRDVPDPYYSDESAFEEVYAILDAACRGLLEQLERDARVP